MVENRLLDSSFNSTQLKLLGEVSTSRVNPVRSKYLHKKSKLVGLDIPSYIGN